jgi:hypothetical protein
MQLMTMAANVVITITNGRVNMNPNIPPPSISRLKISAVIRMIHVFGIRRATLAKKRPSKLLQALTRKFKNALV